jgi:hypothetical protein
MVPELLVLLAATKLLVSAAVPGIDTGIIRRPRSGPNSIVVSVCIKSAPAIAVRLHSTNQDIANGKLCSVSRWSRRIRFQHPVEFARDISGLILICRSQLSMAHLLCKRQYLRGDAHEVSDR